MSGDFDHVLIATSLPWLLGRGMHFAEAWSEAVAGGGWGEAFVPVAERVRQTVDLEHWAAFGESFARLAEIIRSVAAGERGPAPASVVVLSGDVHHAYLFEVAFPRGSGVRSSVWQAVCSPYRNPLERKERRVIRLGMSRPFEAVWRALARSAGVDEPPVRWRMVGDGPWFDNQVASLRIDGRKNRDGPGQGRPDQHGLGAARSRTRPPLGLDSKPMDYPVETFTAAERAALAPHFTNLDAPVFALVNLPETVKGALFARYSRYQGTLRRLYLDEFAGEAAPGASFDGEEGERARKLYERIFLGYGDDSVAQLGGAHIAMEWVSNVMTKLLQRGRLAAYLEQSTRYIPYDAPIAEGLGYRYWRNPELGPPYEAAMDSLFDSYSEALPRVMAWAEERFPRAPDQAEGAYRGSIKAKALDLLRGLLPAASLSHMGMFASGQAYEQLLLRLYASPLPEARDYADMILAELKAVMPSFVARVERPERGGEWISYFEERGEAAERWTERLGLDRARLDERGGAGGAPAVGGGRRGRAARGSALRGRRLL